MALISICVPTFNGALHLRDCLDSALAQTFDDFEIVINDDGSSDATLSIVHEYAQRDDRIRVHRNPSALGLPGNWNRTVDLASTPWIKLLFQDDTLHRDCLAELHALATSRDLAFVACFRDIAFDDSIEGYIRAWFAQHRAFVAGLFDEPVMSAERVAATCLDHFACNFIGEPTVTMLHRRVFEDIGYFDPALSQRIDTEFWYRAGLRHGVGVVQRSLATFRFHAASASAGNLAQRKFVDEQLDPLAMRCRVLFDERYQLVRRLASERAGGIAELERLFETEIRHAIRMAREDLAAGNPASWQEWRRAVARCPQLDRPSARR